MNIGGKKKAGSWKVEVEDLLGQWFMWLGERVTPFLDQWGLNHRALKDRLMDWLVLMGWHFIVLMVLLILGCSWVATCYWAASFSEPEPQEQERKKRRKGRRRREGAASTGARLKKRKVYSAPPKSTGYNRAVLKSLRVEEEKRTGKKLPNVRSSYRERHPGVRSVPANCLSYKIQPKIKPETRVCTPSGSRISNLLRYRMALYQWDDSELETFYIWIRPNGRRVAEVSEMQVARYPRSVRAAQPLEMDKKNEEWEKSMLDAKAVENSSCHDGKEVGEGTLKQREPDEV